MSSASTETLRESTAARAVRRFRYYYRNIARPRTIRIDGLEVIADPNRLPAHIVMTLYKESYERPERALARRVLGPGDRVLEIGAGVGLVTMICARRCGAENILSYEANPVAAKIARDNFKLNGLDVTLREKAVSTTSGEVVFHQAENIFSSSMLEREKTSKTRVPCDNAAVVVEEFHPNTLVMDVEGAEIELLRLIPLAGIRKLLLEVHPHVTGQESLDRLIPFIAASGLKVREDLSRSNVLFFDRRG